MTNLDENYAKAGYHKKQTWGDNPALLLVDFANAYFDEMSPLFGGDGCEHALDNAVILADAARARGVPVIFTEVKYQKGGANGGAFYQKVPALKVFDEGQDTQRLASPLRVIGDDIMVTKQYPSAFFGTSLDATLRSMGVDTLLITGLTTSGCVRASCIDSVSFGFVTLVVSDAVGDRAVGPHDANLFDMSAKYADLLTTRDAIKYFDALKSAG
ncbi:isochorismatase family protein [Oceaniglobus ichthyenteri]|uniref:isochorismatase family protein n=1 Tax=Oceaniglobus ichthyenteri TaxID=2136177 RepID=UPI000D3D4A54|nr:isochorismatase family protein [Oceaniglobus ichthyenteri]